MNNIDEHGAPSMMMHMEPHILEFDAHSGDFGLGFFGCSLQSGAYYVEHPDLGPVCYLCNMDTQGAVVTIRPVDLYHRRLFIEPLALHLTLDTGKFESVQLDMAAKSLTAHFNPMATDNIAYATLQHGKSSPTIVSWPSSQFHLVRCTHDAPRTGCT